MTADEREQLGEKLASLWEKFQPEDLVAWYREMDGYQLDAVFEALIEYRNSSVFKPTFPEIEKILKKNPNAKQQQRAPRRSTSLCDSIIRANPQLANKSDAELIIGYHRHWCRKYVMELDAAAQCGKRGMTADEQRRINLKRDSTRQTCAIDLVATGMEVEAAQHFASAATMDQPEYEQLIEELKQAGACPASA